MRLPRQGLRRLAADLAKLGAEPPDAAESPAVGRYRLGAFVGRGSQGAVWRAVDPVLRRVVAVKVLTTPLADGARPFASAVDAAELLAATELSHPGLARVFEGGVTRALLRELGDTQAGTRRQYCAMEWVEGDSATKLMTRGALAADRAIELVLQAARALAAAHRAGLLHLDLKPAKILCSPRGPRLIDLAITRRLAHAAHELPHPAPGTIGFMAPEQAFGPADELDARADVHGLGATLAALVTGSNLPDDEDLARVEPRLLEVIERATDRDPERRYRSAAAFAAALEELGATPEPVSTKSSRTWPIAVAALAVVLWALAALLPGDQPETVDQLLESARYSEALERLAAQPDGAGDGWSPAEELARLRAQAGVALASFSFHPADLPGFAELFEHGELAGKIEDLVASHQRIGAPPPRELAVVELLLTWSAGAKDGAQRGRAVEQLVSAFPGDRDVQLAASLLALVEADGARAAAAVQGLDRDAAVELVHAAADLLEHGASADRDALAELAEQHPFLHSDLGLFELAADQPEEALEHLDRALASHPELASAHHLRAVALDRLGRRADALAELAWLVAALEATPAASDPLPLAVGDGLGARSSASYSRPSSARLRTDPWLADLRQTERYRDVLGPALARVDQR
ncbi:MAG: hypothetical protein P1V81_02810 [Planctomycetota bacterium]|nr:hypothetical protein [Planctomycetota bacterium]